MGRETCIWHGIQIAVHHGDAPKNRELYRFLVTKVTPATAHLPLQTSQHGYHYVSKDEVGRHANFRAYLLARLERDAPKGLLMRNARVIKQSHQFDLDLQPPPWNPKKR